jgi:hypothetical protein
MASPHSVLEAVSVYDYREDLLVLLLLNYLSQDGAEVPFCGYLALDRRT